jgi:hypothetical protein
VGILASVDKFKIFEVVFKSGKFILDWESLALDPLYTIAITHIELGICIDIFLYHEHENSYVTGVNYDWKFVKCFKFSKFDIKKVKFSELDVYIPDNYELNLSENFGPEWEKEDKNYISHLESPSGLDNESDIYILLIWIHLVQSIKKRNQDKIKRLWSIAKNYSSNDLAPTQEYFKYSLLSENLENPSIVQNVKELSYAN